MDKWLIKWNGPSKIKGIIAIRNVFGLRLKEAIHVLDYEDGFVCTQLQWIALRGEYMLHADIGVVGTLPDRYINDWLVEAWKPTKPKWLCEHTPKSED